MEIKPVTTQKQLDDAFFIRKTVFVQEQGVALADEFDKYDATAIHLLVYFENEPVGTARMRIVDETAKFERICILAPYRKYGLGKLIICALEQLAIEKELKKAKLHGQTQAEGFYQKLGYETKSPVFMEDGIPHILMVKNLYATAAGNIS